MVLFLKILGGVAALALGVFLGTGRYTQTTDDIDARLQSSGQPRKTKSHFMWLNYFRAVQRGSDRRRSQSGPRFKTAVSRDVTKHVTKRESGD
jgi:hypothetical protein